MTEGWRYGYSSYSRSHALGTNFYGVLTGTIDRPSPAFVAGLCASGTAEMCIRDPLGDLVGKGRLLVFDSWKGPEPYCSEPCPPPKHDGRLFRVDGGKAVEIASSSGELTPLAADSDRILVDEGSGMLAVLDAEGSSHTTVFAPGHAEARLQGPDLVVHQGLRVTDYDTETGMELHTWPVPADAMLEDVQGGVAVYITAMSVHLLRLADGRDAAIDPPGHGPLHAALEAPGLFYSYAVDDGELSGRVAFVPSAALP